MNAKIIEVIKDLFLSILIVACISGIVLVIFYDKISLGKLVPEAEEYILSEQMQSELKNVEEDTEEIIVNYQLDSSDLKKYEKDKEYIKGKSNPFAKIDKNTEILENNVSNNTNIGNNNTNIENGTASGNFYPDYGTK